jgi:hypothetical protein
MSPQKGKNGGAERRSKMRWGGASSTRSLSGAKRELCRRHEWIGFVSLISDRDYACCRRCGVLRSNVRRLS